MTQKLIEKHIKDIKKIDISSRNHPKGYYDSGIDHCEKLLKLSPNHPDGMMYLALFYQYSKEKEKAEQLINQAVRINMKNAEVWKFKGLIHKDQKDYANAMKAMTMSNRLNPNDTDVLRDLSSLYLQERNYKLFLEQAGKLLSKSSHITSVTRYALAQDLNNNPEAALKILDVYESNMTPNVSQDELVFRNELGLYHLDLLIRTGKYEDAINYVEHYFYFKDSMSVSEMIAKCYLALEKKNDLIQIVHKMLDYYPENGDYFNMLESVLSPEDYLKELFSIKDKLKSRYAEVRILEILDINDSRFEELLKSYLQPYLKKGAPSVYTTLEELSLEKLDMAAKIAKETDVLLCYVPNVHLFVANVLAAHKDYQNALNEIDAGLKHTPTFIDLIYAKARILKKSGRISEATEFARQLADADPNDRNANTLYVNYLLKNGNMDEAFKVGRPFSIDHNQLSKILITQNNQLFLHIAECALRGGDIPLATKFYENVITTFIEYKNSKFNYLGWGLRQIKSLYDILMWDNELINEPVYGTAVSGLISLAILNDKLESVANIALQMIEAKKGQALAHVSVYFALKNDPLPAIKLFRRLSNSDKFLAAPAVEKMVSSIASALPLVQEVTKELYEPCTEKPSSFSEIANSAKGHLYIKDISTAKDLFKQALNNFDYSFKEALDLYITIKIGIKDDSYTNEFETEVHKKYPDYQLQYPTYLPFNFDENSDEYKKYKFSNKDD